MSTPRSKTSTSLRRKAALVGATAAVAIALPVLPALAVSGVSAAYWWQGNGAGAAPQVPDGGLYVSSSPAGQQSVSTLRFTLDQGETAPVVTLQIAHIESADAAAATGLNATPVLACPVKGDWKMPAGGHGNLSDAPAGDCTHGSVTGELSTDKKSMKFDLSLLDVGPVVDVILMPGQVSPPSSGTVPGAPTSVYPSFDIAFAKVVPSQIEVSQGGTGGGTGSLGGAGGGTGPSGGVSAPPDTGSAPAAPSGAFLPAQASAPGLDQSPVVANAPSGSSSDAVAPQVAAPSQALRPVAVQATRWDRDRIILVLLVLNIGIYIWWEGNHRDATGQRPRRNLFDPPPAPETDAG